MSNFYRLTRHRLACLLALCLVAATLLSACGKDNTDNKVASNQNEVTEAPETTIEEEAQPEVEEETEIEQTETEEKLDPATYEWPKEFSLYETYADDFLIGTIYTDDIRSGVDKELTTTHFNVITPENIMKPEYMQPTEGNFNYSNSDKMMQFADETGLKVVGHTLAWHSQTGKWLGRNVTREESIEQLRSHITNIVGQYKGKIIAWDVVNEAIADGMTLPADGDWTKCLRKTQWLTSIGPDYLAMAFTFAHEADPDAKLYYNDYNLNVKSKADVAYAMVKDLREQGVPIHGIGMQGHYNTGTSIGTVEYSLSKFAELGVEVSITELDVTENDASPAGLTEEQEIQQGIVYAELFQVFKEYKDVIERVTFWGHVDTKSWRSERFPNIFNGDYSPKLAAYAVLDPETYLELYQMDEEEKVTKVVQAKYGTPVIDGEVDEIWNSSTAVDIKTQVMAWEGATGKVKVLWDEAYVYALIEVQDNVLNKQSQNVYEHDSVEIFLDQNNEKSPYYDDNDGQYRVNYEGENSFGSYPDTPGYSSAAKTINGGYLVEVAIPLLETATEGKIMGFDAQINDSNAYGMRQSIAKFNDSSDNSWSTTEDWGNLELVK